MTEAVIVATARSPIGRANKGSLVDLRPDDMAAQIVRALMAKVPQVSPADIEDLIMGCGQPAGEAGFNIGRVVAGLAGLDDVPGVTVNRYCSSSLQTIRMAAHAIKAGEGDCFIAAGVESRQPLRPRRQRHRSEPDLRRPRHAHGVAQPGRSARRGPRPRVCPTSTSPWARPPRTSVEIEGVTREEMDEFGVRSQQRAVRRDRQRASSSDEITPLTLPDGTVVSKDDGPRAGTTAEKLAQLKPVFRPDGDDHRRQRLPAQRRRRGRAW